MLMQYTTGLRYNEMGVCNLLGNRNGDFVDQRTGTGHRQRIQEDLLGDMHLLPRHAFNSIGMNYSKSSER